jgi:hypothetical protein
LLALEGKCARAFVTLTVGEVSGSQRGLDRKRLDDAQELARGDVVRSRGADREAG